MYKDEILRHESEECCEQNYHLKRKMPMWECLEFHTIKIGLCCGSLDDGISVSQ